MIPINREQVIELLGGVDTRTVTKFIKLDVDPLPVDTKRGHGRADTFDAVEVTNWMLRRQARRYAADKNGVVHDYETERARLTHHNANKAQMEAEVVRGSLIPAEIVEQVQGDMVDRAKSRLLSLPTKAAPALLNLKETTKAQKILKDYVYEALEELATYDPAQYGIHTGGEALESSTGTDS